MVRAAASLSPSANRVNPLIHTHTHTHTHTVSVRYAITARSFLRERLHSQRVFTRVQFFVDGDDDDEAW